MCLFNVVDLVLATLVPFIVINFSRTDDVSHVNQFNLDYAKAVALISINFNSCLNYCTQNETQTMIKSNLLKNFKIFS